MTTMSLSRRTVLGASAMLLAAPASTAKTKKQRANASRRDICPVYEARAIRV